MDTDVLEAIKNTLLFEKTKASKHPYMFTSSGMSLKFSTSFASMLSDGMSARLSVPPSPALAGTDGRSWVSTGGTAPTVSMSAKMPPPLLLCPLDEALSAPSSPSLGW